MASKEVGIIEAAIRVFSLYGVKRATMSDIASEAGIARQTLYNAFANKDELLRGAIRWHADHALAAISREVDRDMPLDEKLDVAFKHLVVEPYQALHASPHADDIISGFNQAAKDELAAADKRYRAAIEKILTPHRAQLRAADMNARQLSDLIQKSAAAFKHGARDRKHLLTLLNSLKRLVLNQADAK